MTDYENDDELQAYISERAREHEAIGARRERARIEAEIEKMPRDGRGTPSSPVVRLDDVLDIVRGDDD